jgi:hypothetical protein
VLLAETERSKSGGAVLLQRRCGERRSGDLYEPAHLVDRDVKAEKILVNRIARPKGMVIGFWVVTAVFC